MKKNFSTTVLLFEFFISGVLYTCSVARAEEKLKDNSSLTSVCSAMQLGGDYWSSSFLIMTQAEEAMRRKAAALETNYRIAQVRGDYAKTEAIRAEFSNLQTEGEALRRLKAVQSFEMGDPRDMQYQIFEMSKGRLKLQPRSDGKYNLLLDNKVNREGVSKEQLAAEMRSSYCKN